MLFTFSQFECCSTLHIKSRSQRIITNSTVGKSYSTVNRTNAYTFCNIIMGLDDWNLRVSHASYILIFVYSCCKNEFCSCHKGIKNIPYSFDSVRLLVILKKFELKHSLYFLTHFHHDEKLLCVPSATCLLFIAIKLSCIVMDPLKTIQKGYLII